MGERLEFTHVDWIDHGEIPAFVRGDYVAMVLPGERERDRRLDTAVVVCEQQADRIEQLEAIVDRLPKTADGVPVVPGAIVYVDLAHIPRWGIFGVGSLEIEGWDTRSEAAVFRNTPEGNKPGETEEIFFAIEDCYSTPEAAQAAREQEGGG